MVKLVLAIIAVTLLQVAFFVYVGNDGADHMTVGEIAARSDERGVDLGRVIELPEAVAPVNPPLPDTAVAVAEQTKIRPSSATGRSARIAKPRHDVPVRDRLTRTSARVSSGGYERSSRSVGERIVVPKQAGASLPRGYTMVLVDYPPVVSIKKEKEIAKPRKRSYLARALPALVRKPWNWIKSIASKLD